MMISSQSFSLLNKQFILCMILLFFSFGNAQWPTGQFEDLTDETQDALVTLGYNEVSWNCVLDPYVTTSCVYWQNLTSAQQSAAEFIGFDQDTWDTAVSQCPWDWANCLWFEDLPEFLKEAAMIIGYDQDSWNADLRVPTECYLWADLSDAEREALELFGYTEELWDGVDEDDGGDEADDGGDEEVDDFCEEVFLNAIEDEVESEPCLSGYSQVQVLGKGYTFLKDVEQGDNVLVSSSSSGSLDEYQKVYMFGHKDVYAVSDILQITTLGNRDTSPLEITGQHLVLKQGSPAVSGGVPVRADSIVVGDFLIGDKGIGELVTQISSVKRPGLYSPVTKDGKFLANGILVSSYTATQGKHPESLKVGSLEVASHHFVSHAAIAPFRFLCLVSDGFKSLCEQRNHEGQLLFAAIGEKYTVEKKEGILGKQIIAATVFSIILVPFYFMEQVVGGFVMMCLFPMAWLLVARFLYISFGNEKNFSVGRNMV